MVHMAVDENLSIILHVILLYNSVVFPITLDGPVSSSSLLTSY